LGKRLALQQLALGKMSTLPDFEFDGLAQTPPPHQHVGANFIDARGETAPLQALPEQFFEFSSQVARVSGYGS
jgi:hypothetical protein